MLFQHVRLVEVTSNIWGTKFKIHGLVNCVPANLGQVTYKTSLLHLQPRQMSLVMTELRDDFPTGPDPTFNPNLFSEDEEDQLQAEERLKLHRTTVENCPPIAPMSPRSNRINRPKQPISNHLLPKESHNVRQPSTKADTNEEEHVHSKEDVVRYCEAIRPHCSNGHISNQCNGRTSNSIQTTSFMGQYTRNVSTTSSTQRHVISPLCCEGSVPALQSPKNAVAPSDIIFDRPPAQTLISYSTADYTGTSNNVQQVKSSIVTSHCRSTIPQTLSITSEQQKQYVVKKDQTESHKHCSNSSDHARSKNKDVVHSNAHKGNKQCNSSGSQNGVTSEKMKSLDEETFEETAPGSSKNMTGLPYIADSMIRSCSVGYLDVVDVELMPGDVALQMLRKDAPKRFVLVNPKTKHRKHKKQMGDQRGCTGSSRLQNCGKSKSLDSSDIFPPFEFQNIRKKVEKAIPEIEMQPQEEPEVNLASTRNSTTQDINRYNKLNFFSSKSPLMRRKKSEGVSSHPADNKTLRSRSRTKQKAPLPNRKEGTGPLDTTAQENGKNNNGVSLHTHALATLENLITRLRDDNSKTTPPSSPRLPRSSPASPVPSKKGKLLG